ncbi:uncharacterized protein LOC142502190 [Ascaphus truei]|uniref:uncharacterized protein LOC142502190 n=1 Tax=Ascaphus truei TaxID=8439 RepID=UPI003F59811F
MQRESDKRHVYKKVIKPVIERQRRARINSSLEQLRTLLKESSDETAASLWSRMDKAHILEMTLSRLRGEQTAVSQDALFLAGFTRCQSLTDSFLASESPVGSDLRPRLSEHMTRALCDLRPRLSDDMTRTQTDFRPLEPALQDYQSEHTPILGDPERLGVRDLRPPPGRGVRRLAFTPPQSRGRADRGSRGTQRCPLTPISDNCTPRKARGVRRSENSPSISQSPTKENLPRSPLKLPHCPSYLSPCPPSLSTQCSAKQPDHKTQILLPPPPSQSPLTSSPAGGERRELSGGAPPPSSRGRPRQRARPHRDLSHPTPLQGAMWRPW